jgi:Zn-finger domain-containing protein
MLHKTFTLSIVLYVSETWTLSQEDIDVIDSFERKILRKMFGPTQAKSVRRST